MAKVTLSKDSLTVPTIIFNNGVLSSDENGNLTWNGQQVGGGTLDASGDITFTGLDAFTQYVTFNGGMISNGDIILNGSKLLLANGASVELYTGDGIPLPEGGVVNPGTGNSGGSIDTSNFAKLNEDNIFTGNNNFTGTLTLNDKSILTTDDLTNYVTNDDLTNKNYLTSSSLTDYAKTSDLSSYATTSSLSSYLKKSDIGVYITQTWDNGTNWYRKYSDGRMEMGGKYHTTTSGGSALHVTVNLPTAFYNTLYDVFIQPLRLNSLTDYSSLYAGAFLRTSTSSFAVYLVAANGGQYIDGFVWTAKGRWAVNN